MAQVIKNLPAVQETQEIQVWSLGREDPLEEGTAAHFSILTWKIPWTEDLVGYSPEDYKELDMAEHTHVCPQHRSITYNNSVTEIFTPSYYPLVLNLFSRSSYRQWQMWFSSHIFVFSIISYEEYHTPCCSWIFVV